VTVHRIFFGFALLSLLSSRPSPDRKKQEIVMAWFKQYLAAAIKEAQA
jgi:hypothetical protein